MAEDKPLGELGGINELGPALNIPEPDFVPTKEFLRPSRFNADTCLKVLEEINAMELNKWLLTHTSDAEVMPKLKDFVSFLERAQLDAEAVEKLKMNVDIISKFAHEVHTVFETLAKSEQNYNVEHCQKMQVFVDITRIFKTKLLSFLQVEE